MATGEGFALPKLLHNEDSKSWFKRYVMCSLANGWNAGKQLLELLMLLEGSSWEIFDSLSDTETDMHDHLKAAILSRLCPDVEEDKIVVHDHLSPRKHKFNEI